MLTVVVTGEVASATMMALLSDDGLKRPYRVATLDVAWFEAARAQNRPRMLFKSKMSLMQFVRLHDILCVHPRIVRGIGQEEMRSMVATMDAMGARFLPIAGG